LAGVRRRARRRDEPVRLALYRFRELIPVS
jgi:hypothetical protein